MRLFLCAVALAASASAGALSESSCSDFTLANGMKWIVCERPGSGNFAALLHGQAGTVHEAAGSTGVSQVARLLLVQQAQAAGLKTTFGFANHDRVGVAHRDVPAAELEKVMAVDAALLAKPDLAGFDAARASIVAEWKKRDASGSWLMWEFERAAFLAHPYGQPTWGFLEDLERLTPTDVDAHLRKTWSPANVIGAVIGDVKPARVREVVEARFGKLTGSPVVPPLKIVEPQQRTERRVAVANGPAGVLVAYHKGGVGDPSYPAWDVLLGVLNARLKAEVVEREKLAVRADGYFGPAMRYPSLVEVLAFGAPGAPVAKIESAVHGVFEKLRTGGITEEELARVRPSAGSPDNGRDLDFAMHITDWQSMTGEWRNIFRHSQRVTAVTLDQVNQLARDTFDPARRTVATSGK